MLTKNSNGTPTNQGYSALDQYPGSPTSMANRKSPTSLASPASPISRGRSQDDITKGSSTGTMSMTPSSRSGSPRRRQSRMRTAERTEMEKLKDADTLEDEERQKRLRQVRSARSFDWIKTEQDCNDPDSTIKLLLSHVRLDPDGGIMNLADHNQEHDGTQHSKVACLKKNQFEKWLALNAVVRFVGNPVAITYFGCHLLYLFLSGEFIRVEVQARLKGLRLPVSISWIFALTAATELVGITVLVVRALYHAVRACCSARETDSKWEPSPRYMFLAKLWWNDRAYLESFSALSPLAFIHPNLLTKNVKEYTMRDEFARALLEKLLMIEPDSLNDDDLVFNVAAVILEHDRYKRSEDAFCPEEDVSYSRNKAGEYLNMKPHELLDKLKFKIGKDKQYLRKQNLNADAIYSIRYAIILLLEHLFLHIVMIMTGCMGLIAFMSKICRCFLLLADPEVPRYVAPIFFFAFLNQVMGIINISRLLQWRIECFIFGGCDAHVSSEEHFTMQVYMGSLCEAIWKSKEFSFTDKMCIMLQFDDDDLQQLVIEDATKQKAAVVLRVRQYMHETSQMNWFKEWLVNSMK